MNDELKLCVKCDQEKSLRDFPAVGRWCLECRRAWRREYNQKNKERRRKYDQKYWLSNHLYEIRSHGGRCACCGETEPLFLRVTGERVLCFNCSTAIRRDGKCPHEVVKSKSANA